MMRCERCEILAGALTAVVKAHGECLDALTKIVQGTMTTDGLVSFLRENERNITALEKVKAHLEAVAVKNGVVS